MAGDGGNEGRDGSVTAGGNGNSFCSRNQPDGGRCWDFDGEKGDTTVLTKNGTHPIGPVFLSEDVYFSPPQALHSRLGPTDRYSYLDARLELNPSFERLNLKFQLRDTGCTQPRILLDVRFVDKDGGARSISLHRGSQAFAAFACPKTGECDEPVTIPAAAEDWSSVALDVSSTTANLTGALSVGSGSTPQALPALNADQPDVFVSVRLGQSTILDGVPPECAAFYDDVTLSIR